MPRNGVLFEVFLYNYQYYLKNTEGSIQQTTTVLF